MALGIETVNGVRTLTLAAVPASFTGWVPVFAERSDGMWRAIPEILSSESTWSIRLNGSASAALRAALGIQQQPARVNAASADTAGLAR